MLFLRPGGGGGMHRAAFGCHVEASVLSMKLHQQCGQRLARLIGRMGAVMHCMHGRTAGRAVLRRASQHGPAVAKGG